MMPDDEFNPDAGLLRLFPLPNLVLFPGAMQPLHIFEPRYRQMTAAALAGDRLITMALPRPGWEADYAGRPAVHPVACAGRIVADQRLADGRFNILLRGLRRVRIAEEVPQPTLYRAARFEVLDEEPCADPAAEADWRARLRGQAPHWFATHAEVRERFVELIDSELALGPLADLIAFALPLDAELKQTLLAELNVARRLDRLLRHLDVPHRAFPPEFSPN